MNNDIYKVLEISNKLADEKNLSKLKSLRKKFVDNLDRNSFEDQEIDERYYLLECLYQIDSIIDSIAPENKSFVDLLSNKRSKLTLARLFARDYHQFKKNKINFNAKFRNWNNETNKLFESWIPKDADKKEFANLIQTAYSASNWLKEDGTFDLVKASKKVVSMKTLQNLGIAKLAIDSGYTESPKPKVGSEKEKVSAFLPKVRHKTGKTTYYFGFNITPANTHGEIFKKYFNLKKGSLQKNIVLKIKNNKYDAQIRCAKIDNSKYKKNSKRSGRLYPIRDLVQIQYNLKSQSRTLQEIKRLGGNRHNEIFEIIHLHSNIFKVDNITLST